MPIVPGADYSGDDLSDGVHTGDALGSIFNGTNFHNADLRRVSNLSCEQIQSAKCTCGAKLPPEVASCKGRCNCTSCDH